MSECKYKLNVSYLLLMDLIRLYESNMYLWGLAVRWDVAFRVNIPVIHGPQGPMHSAAMKIKTTFDVV